MIQCSVSCGGAFDHQIGGVSAFSRMRFENLKGAFDHQIGGVSAFGYDGRIILGGAFDHQIGGVSASTDKAL